MLGVVTSIHNADTLSYHWFKGDDAIGNGQCLLIVDSPGTYFCRVNVTVLNENSGSSNIQVDSYAIQIVEVTKGNKLYSRYDLSTAINTDVKDTMTKANSSLVTDHVICASDLTVHECERIDQGAFGQVFKGNYKKQIVAIKQIYLRSGKRPDRLIMREADIHSKITHPNIVQFIGTCVEKDRVSIVTELVAGSNMDDLIYSGYIVRGEKLDRRQKLELAADVARGVSYLHEHQPQIIHQDLKPANILVDEREVTAKICDLGLAKIQSHSIASSTNALILAGTPEYMAPERLVSHDKATAASDIWSLGIMLGEWFGGEDPWNMQEQEDDPLVFLRTVMMRQDLPEIFSRHSMALLVPCISYVPTERPCGRKLLQRLECPRCSNVDLC